MADSLNKDYVVFSPGSTDYQVKVLNRFGIKVYNNIRKFKESEALRK